MPIKVFTKRDENTCLTYVQNLGKKKSFSSMSFCNALQFTDEIKELGTARYILKKLNCF